MIEFFGRRTLGKLGSILYYHKPKRIFLVTGKHSYESSGAKEFVEPFIKKYAFFRFFEFETNPKLEDIKEGIRLFRENKSDLVLAIGGGSVIDVAKSINVLAANPGNPLDYIKKRKLLQNKGKILVAIPTTSGSGSEATHFSVVYISKEKYSLAHEEFMLPDYSIIDPELTMHLPKHITATSGIDALCQAIESYWCINSTEESKRYAKEAIQLAINNLEAAVNNPSEKSRELMSKAAHLAGKAINITQTTAPHAISYPMTSYFNVPHGQAVALTIPEMFIYNADVTKNDLLDKRGVNYVKLVMNNLAKMVGCKDIEDASKRISSLMRSIGLETRLSELGIDHKGMKIIIQNGFNPDRIKNNPRRLTEETLRNILNNVR